MRGSKEGEGSPALTLWARQRPRRLRSGLVVRIKKPPPGWEGGRRNASAAWFLHGLRLNGKPRRAAYRRSPLVQSRSVTGSPPSWQGSSQPPRVDWPAAGYLLPEPSLGAHRPVCQRCWSPVVAGPGGCRPWFSRLGPRGGAAMVPLCIYRRGVQVGCGVVEFLEGWELGDWDEPLATSH